MKKYFDSIAATNGAAIPGASITVYQYGTTTKATLYANSTGSTTKDNPLTSDATGYFEFYAADGRYTIVVSASGMQSKTVTDVLLEDPSDANPGVFTSISVSGAASIPNLAYQPAGTGAATDRTVEGKLREWVTLEDFGAIADGTGTGGTDNYLSIEKAILYSATTGKAIHVTGKYYTSKPLNFSSVSGDARHNAKFIGYGKPDVFNGTGAIFYVGSGAGYACVEIIDSYHCNLIGIGLCGISGTSIGIVASRGTFNAGPGHHLIRDCVVYVTSTLTMNSNVGSIGLLNVACEETNVDNCDFWAAIPAAHTHLNEVNIFNVDAGGLPLNTVKSFSYTSYYATPLVSVSSSNTVFRYSGQCRFIALNYQGPNILIETTSELDLGHTFMQRVADPVNPSTPQGTYPYGFQMLSVFGLQWRGTIEHCESMALICGELDNAQIDCTLGSSSSALAEIMFLEPTAGDRPLIDNEITIRGIANKAPAKCVRNTATSLPCLFKLIETTFKTTSTLQPLTADPGFWNMLGIAKSSSVTFYDKELVCSQGLFKFDKIVYHGTSNVLFDIYMPDTGATGSFYLSAKADCVTQNVVASQSAGVGSIYTSVNEWVGANQITGFGPYFEVKKTSGSSVNFAPLESYITDLVPTEVTTSAIGKCSFIITPTITGSNIQPTITKASVTVQCERVDGHTIMIF